MLPGRPPSRYYLCERDDYLERLHRSVDEKDRGALTCELLICPDGSRRHRLMQVPFTTASLAVGAPAGELARD